MLYRAGIKKIFALLTGYSGMCIRILSKSCIEMQGLYLNVSVMGKRLIPPAAWDASPCHGRLPGCALAPGDIPQVYLFS